MLSLINLDRHTWLYCRRTGNVPELPREPPPTLEVWRDLL
jgi:hypothetical protein